MFVGSRMLFVGRRLRAVKPMPFVKWPYEGREKRKRLRVERGCFGEAVLDLCFKNNTDKYKTDQSYVAGRV